jgi:hydroxyacylglutathione hydrolase
MKRLNRDGVPPRPRADALRPVDAAGIAKALERGYWVVDIRRSMDFANGHIPGTVNIPASKSLPTYAGTVLSYDRPIYLIARSQDQATQAIAQLALIGLDDIAGWAGPDVLQQWKSAGRPMATSQLVDPAVLAGRLSGTAPRVIDVRGGSEWNHGHLAGRADELDRSEPIVVHCQGGTRSSIAASLLERDGFSNVAILAGGIDAWQKAGLPVVR